MSFATMAGPRRTFIALSFFFCALSPAARGDDVTPSEAEKRAFAAKDEDEANRWLKIAANGGQRDAQWLLGERYLRGDTSAGKNVELGIDLLRRAAMQGSARAQSMLGYAYLRGMGVKPDEAEALKWFTAAARQESGYALTRLSHFYYNGRVVARDHERAKRLLFRAAELGDPEGVIGAWHVLLVGKEDDRNAPLGMHFLMRAANRDDADSAYVLGREYLTGRDVPRDPARAAHWFERAAKAKHALASLWLSELHAKGLGVQQDRSRAERMLEDALNSAGIRDKNIFSWALSVAPDAQLRNPALAIRVLEPALAKQKEKSPTYLDTLAAAYAEHGQFDKAVSTQLEALQAVRRSRSTEPVPDMEQRLELYRAGKAYREEML